MSKNLVKALAFAAIAATIIGAALFVMFLPLFTVELAFGLLLLSLLLLALTYVEASLACLGGSFAACSVYELSSPGDPDFALVVFFIVFAIVFGGAAMDAANKEIEAYYLRKND